VSFRNFRNNPVVAQGGAALVSVALAVLGYRAYGWGGVALAAGGLVMWVLLHMTRMLLVLRRTAGRPVGSVASAVMLHARLQRGMTLLQVLALTRALGQCVSPPNADPEVYQWTDGGNVLVRCTFARGTLAQWELLRP
jgi:hypothetical protein